MDLFAIDTRFSDSPHVERVSRRHAANEVVPVRLRAWDRRAHSDVLHSGATEEYRRSGAAEATRVGLAAGKQAGARIPDEAWKIIKELYKDAQNDDGSWGYTARDSATIPALLAQELARRGVTHVEVVNQTGVGAREVAGFAGRFLDEADLVAEVAHEVAAGDLAEPQLRPAEVL